MQPAAVVSVAEQTVDALLANGNVITIPWQGLSWARPQIPNQRYPGPKPTQAGDIVKVGDVIRVRQTANGWRLTQIPQVQGALVSLNPNNGAIQALVGGYSHQLSHYNRAIQADRQPGSSFKPFIYSGAINNGFTLANIINDAPVVQADSGENSLWRPHNDTERFYGPTSLRVGLIHSRNIVSIRLLQDVGIAYTLNYVSRFGFNPQKLPHTLSLALGSGVVTPLELASGYAVFANGGYKVSPYFIDHITDEDGNVSFQASPATVCMQCKNINAQIPLMEPVAKRVISAQNAYLITNVLQQVITKGTGRAAKILKRTDLAGKTGTTNKQMDAWFSGFNRDLVTTVWVGFDDPRTLYEYGAQAALPIWIKFMGSALAGKPEETMIQPPGLVNARIDPNTGLLASPAQKNAIFEIFRQQYAPTKMDPNPTALKDDFFDANENSDQHLF